MPFVIIPAIAVILIIFDITFAWQYSASFIAAGAIYLSSVGYIFVVRRFFSEESSGQYLFEYLQSICDNVWKNGFLWSFYWSGGPDGKMVVPKYFSMVFKLSGKYCENFHDFSDIWLDRWWEVGILRTFRSVQLRKYSGIIKTANIDQRYGRFMSTRRGDEMKDYLRRRKPDRAKFWWKTKSLPENRLLN